MLALFKKPDPRRHVNPRFRAYGKARIDIATRAATRVDWERLWKESTNPFPFTWGENWKHCVEYKVTDFAAEVGFFIDILGFPVNAFDPDYAMFTSPQGEFFFSVVPVEDESDATPPDSLRLQFMLKDILDTSEELVRRGVEFEHWPSPVVANSPLLIGSFCTPHGIGIDLWGFDGEISDLESDEDTPTLQLTDLESLQSQDAQVESLTGDEPRREDSSDGSGVGEFSSMDDPTDVEYMSENDI